MNDKIFFSIIVIGYNIEKYLERCLDSVFSQSYLNYEVVFVNDGSTDNTLALAKEYENSNIKYTIIDKKNGGIISARKAGLKAAKGDYIAFVDGDDSIKPDMLLSYANYIDELNLYDIVISDLIEEKNFNKWVIKRNNLKYGEIDYKAYFEGIMDGTIYHYMCSKIYLRSFIEQSGYFDFPNLTVAEDLYSNAIFSINHPRLLYIDYAGYNYHNNSTSVTRDGKNSLIDAQLLTLDELDQYFSSHHGIEYNNYISYQWYLFAFGYIQTRYNYSFKRYLVDKCKSKIKGVKKNPLYINQRKDISCIYGRFLLFLYMRFPVIAKAVDPFIKAIIDLLHISY